MCSRDGIEFRGVQGRRDERSGDAAARERDIQAEEPIGGRSKRRQPHAGGRQREKAKCGFRIAMEWAEAMTRYRDEGSWWLSARDE